MWFFYPVAVAITLIIVGGTLKYFAAASVPLHVNLIVGYTWFCTVIIIVLVPADIWITLQTGGGINALLGVMWLVSYWSTFYLTWAICPLLQGYEDAGDFTVSKRLKTSIRSNLILYSSLGVIGFIGILIMIYMKKLEWIGVMAFCMACSNTFGLVTGAFLLGYGLVEIPRSQWRDADLQFRQKLLSHRIARVAVKLDDAHQELSTAIVIAQATSNQMARNDPLRPCMNVVEKMLEQATKEDPSFKPSGGRMGESDMDYDTDERTMADLRRRLRKAKESYYRYKSDYAGYIWEALELEESVRNIERGKTTTDWSERRFVSTIRPPRTGSLAPFLDTAEYIWRCILRQRAVKTFAVILGIVSFALIFAEATLPFGPDLSLFSHLIRFAGDQEILVQVLAFIPLMYMCICTYFSLIKLGMMTIYYLAPRQTSSVSLLMICSMVARYAAPMCYNFLNLIQLEAPNGTTFENKMGKMKQIPIIGATQFGNIYPIFMVIYTALLASNVISRSIATVGSWRRFRSDYEDAEGFDPSGLVILRKERSWLEQGGVVGENVVPLARNFGGGMEVDVEADHLIKKTFEESNESGRSGAKPGGAPALYNKLVNGRSNDPDEHSGSGGKDGEGSGSGSSHNDRSHRYQPSRDAIAAKYASKHDLRTHSEPISGGNFRSLPNPSHNDALKNTNEKDHFQAAASSGARWDSIKPNLPTFSAHRFAPLRQEKDSLTSQPATSDSLDSIFQGLRSKREASEFDEDNLDLRLLD
ncbi:unnamed protein product [Calypogeia fissa]